MWNDIETTHDLLNFKVVADTIASMIRDGGGAPVSIGVSGSWGVGKSSLVKMIGESLAAIDTAGKYIFIDFNAWLYQGYDDARLALLQKVADKLLEQAEERKTCVEKVQEFIKRINWLSVGKFALPIVSGAVVGSVIGGPVGAIVGVAQGITARGGKPTSEDIEKITEACSELPSEFQKFIKEKTQKSIPKEIEDLRNLFKTLLQELDLNLVILVDDLDRCLPNTAISTLEAMRLLLFIDRTAFIIAADEQMIRNAVKSHFGEMELSDDLVTSYFDKLIQVPIRVPRLGPNEVKGYLILLLADLARRRKLISLSELEQGQTRVIEAIKKSWAGALTAKRIREAFGPAASKLSHEIEIADQIAGIMATSKKINGNPRLIKRFLNNLVIRERVAEAQSMSVSFAELVKLQLLERCSAKAYEYLEGEVGKTDTGKPKFIHDLEEQLGQGKDITPPDSWNEPFIIEWLGLNPPLHDVDLRPFLYLSRDNTSTLACYNELSPECRELLSAIYSADSLLSPLVERLKRLDLDDAEKLLDKMINRCRAEQWTYSTLVQALHIPKAFEALSERYIGMLNSMPPNNRPAPLIPLLKSEPWATELLRQWGEDEKTPSPVKRAINPKGKR